MAGVLFVLSLLLTAAFVVAPIVLTVSIVGRYQQLQRVVSSYAALVRALIAYVERGQWPERSTTPSAAQPPPERPPWYAPILTLLHLSPPATDWRERYDIADDFEDYLTVLREGRTEGERFMRFRRKNFKMQQEVARDVEFCRTYTETLPYMGILGTVLGFFFSPAVFMPTASAVSGSATQVGGLVLALLSTAVALACILVVKLAYENQIVPQVLEFEHSLQVLDDYARRYGDITLAQVNELVAA